jgi:hypothetical protein
VEVLVVVPGDEALDPPEGVLEGTTPRRCNVDSNVEPLATATQG